MFRNIFRAVSKILRRMSRMLKNGLLPFAAFGDGLIGSLLGGGRQYEDVEEVTQVMDQEVVTEISADAPAPRPTSLAQIAKTAFLDRDASRPFDGAFNLKDPVHARLYRWVSELDHSGMIMMRNVRTPMLERHLDTSDDYRCAGLPVFPVAANKNAPTKNAGAPASFFELEADDLSAHPTFI